MATSLVAVVLVALVGTWRQHGYGNVRLRDGLIIGVLSPLGVLVGVVLANTVPERGSSCRSRRSSCWWPGNSRGRRDCARLRTVEILEVVSEERTDRAGDLLKGELDLSTVGKVAGGAAPRGGRPSHRSWCSTCPRLTFLDSTGLRCLVTADERAVTQGGAS